MTEPAHRWGPWQEYRHNDQWIRLAPPPWKAVAQSGGDVAIPGAVELNRLDEEPPGRMQGHSPFPATRPEIRRCPRRPGRRYGQHVRWRLRCRCHPRRHATARFRWADRHPLRFSWRRPADGGVMEPDHEPATPAPTAGLMRLPGKGRHRVRASSTQASRDMKLARFDGLDTRSAPCPDKGERKRDNRDDSQDRRASQGATHLR